MFQFPDTSLVSLPWRALNANAVCMQVPITGLLFASVHPAESFYAEALLGTILSLSLLAADGNLLVPLMAHSLYNTFVLGTEYLL